MAMVGWWQSRRRAPWSVTSRLLAAVVACLVACGDAAPSSGDTLDAGTDAGRGLSVEVIMSDLPGALTAVWGRAADDVWMVGSDPGDGVGPLVLHFDGVGFRRLRSGAGGDLWWVFGFEEGPIYFGGEGGLILRYEDAEFHIEPTPGDQTVYGIWGSGPGDLWAVGGESGVGGFVWRDVGAGFADLSESSADARQGGSMFKVWGRRADDVWFVGESGTCLHFDGRDWTRVATGTELPLFTIHGAASSDALAAVGGFGQGVLLDLDRDGDFQDGLQQATRQLNGVYLRADTGYAVGIGGELRVRAQGVWGPVEGAPKLREDLHSVWIDPEGGVWSVGGQVAQKPLADGVLLHRGGSAPPAWDPADMDGDGTAGADDCDDLDPARVPGAIERCDGVDDDCDGAIDEGAFEAFYPDADADGAGDGSAEPVLACQAPPGRVAGGDDCDDADATLYPGAVDLCDAARRDGDCEGTPNNPAGGCSCEPGATQPCPLPGACAAGVQPCDGGTWSTSCNIAPLDELCNDADDDCDGRVDESAKVTCYPDGDDDGFALAGAVAGMHCPELSTRAAVGGCPAGWTDREPVAGDVDCADTQAARKPGATEVCNGLDDDCNGSTDEGLALVARFADMDGDGAPGTLVMRCATDPDSAAVATDCMDDQADVHPGQLQYFETPVCAAGVLPCLASNGSWVCRPLTNLSCVPALPAASWDYDCDGNGLPAPVVGGACDTGTCGGGSSCGTSGYLDITGLSCGDAASYRSCECSGLQFGMCQQVASTRALACR